MTNLRLFHLGSNMFAKKKRKSGNLGWVNGLVSTSPAAVALAGGCYPKRDRRASDSSFYGLALPQLFLLLPDAVAR